MGGQRQRPRLAAELLQAADEEGEPSPRGALLQGQHSVLAAVIQNRAAEVGVAALDLSSMSLELAQFAETARSFATTLTLLEVHAPSLLGVVETKEGQQLGLHAATRAQFQQVPMPRAAFDDTQGFLAVSRLASAASRAELEGGPTSTACYLAYGAAGALLAYVQSQRGLVLAPGSLTVRCGGSGDHMQIDAASVEALELIQPLRVGSCTSKAVGGASLYRLLNHTKTRAGARLLRATLLQPLCDVATLGARYDCVEELLGDAELAAGVEACLGQMPADLDRVCGGLSLLPAKSAASTLRRIAGMVQSFIQLRELLGVVPSLAGVLQPGQCQLLQAVGGACGHVAFGELLGELNGVMEEDVQSAKNSFLNRTQQCFAVKSGVDGFLDVARQTFCRVTEQVHELARRLREEHSLPSMRVHYTTQKGFYLVIAAATGGRHQRQQQQREEDEEGEEGEAEDSSSGGRRGLPGQRGAALRIPPAFAVLHRTARAAHVTTSELNALNARLRDASNDCLVLTEQVLEVLSQRIVEHYLPLLQRLLDGVALLDMLAGFARFIGASGRQYTRPALTQGGPLALVEARHPLLEALEGSCQPNDAYLALSSSLHIITGPNMSGKSTFLRQVALCVVMAQAGCFVPAAFASLAPCDRLMTRIGTSDSLETSSSSFMVEMQEAAYILAHATPRSLVLIDELGRATSTADGVAVAWAISERLIELGTPTLFATHFVQLAELAALYPNCRAFHFGVEASRDRLDFSWRLAAGASGAGHYGLALARAVGFPPSVVVQAEQVVQELDASEAGRLRAYATPGAAQLEGVYALVHKLACVAEAFRGSGDSRALCRQLRHLKGEAAELVGADL